MPHFHSSDYQVSFGDCDPAGIAYYPNMFRWVDKTYHDWLRGFGGHAHLCAELGAVGLGLIDLKAQFRSPLRDGDHLRVVMIGMDWGTRSLLISYQGLVGERLAFEAQETRGVFVQKDGRLSAAPMAALRELAGL